MKKILIIADNPTIVELIKYALNLRGSYQIIVAFDSTQGLEWILAEQPDCVIIDGNLPHIDGYQPVHSLHNGARTAKIPVLVLGPMSHEKDPTMELLSEADEYLKRPFKPSALNAAIERILHQRQG